MALFIFIILCLVSVSVGIGTLYILGFRKEDDPIFISSPLIALCIWSLVLGIGVSINIPVRILTYLAWGISLALCLITLKFYRYPKLFFPLITCVGIALFISFPYVVHGFSNYAGSPLADGWSYTVFGQYLWENPRCAEGGLAPLYQYAAHLCDTRFIASSLLGFISPLAGWPGDTQAASGYFFPWAFFVYASACTFFIWKRVPQWLSWGYVIIAVVTGWLFTIMISNNFDQALAISFLPALAGFLESFDFAKIRWGILLAIVLSSIVYIYPEMTPFIFLSVLLLLLYHVIRGRVHFISLVHWGGIFFFVFALLVSAYFSTWFKFILSQFSNIQASVRPGEFVASELLSNDYWWLGIWGLGGDINTVDWLRKICALTFLILSIIGFLVLIKNKNWGLVAVQILLSALVAYFIQVQKYSYGAYKLITLLWWLVSYMMVLAVRWLQAKSYNRFIPVLSKGSYLLAIIIVAYLNIMQGIRFDRNLINTDIKLYKELLLIPPIVNNSPVGISVSDPIANMWAMYYLRESITYFFSYQAYPNQPHVLPFMHRSQQVDLSKIRYLLTDAKGFRPEEASMLWHNSVYSLWKIKDSPFFIAGISNPNGVEILNNNEFYWLGNQKTLIDIQSSFTGIISIVGDFMMGPSLSETTERNLMVTSRINGQSHSFAFTIRPGRNIIEVPVSRGNNKIELSVLDEPTINSLPNGDSRVLLLGLQNIQFEFQNEPEEK